MSGGYFDYSQYHIREIADSLRKFLDEKSWEKEDEYGLRPYRDITPTVLSEMEKGYELLRIAEIYAQRIDWYLEGDDGADSFISRLKDDLTKLTAELKS